MDDNCEGVRCMDWSLRGVSGGSIVWYLSPRLLCVLFLVHCTANGDTVLLSMGFMRV